jgi:lactoylglutathione lyase
MTTVRIEHLALWCEDLEAVRDFYVHWFGAQPNRRYDNPVKGFSSYFLSFDSGPRLELMSRTDVGPHAGGERLGYAHLSIQVGGEAAVDALAADFSRAGVTVVDGPRRTGDGYYEAVVLDPEGNRIELCA